MILNFLYFTIFIFVFREHCLYFSLSVYRCSIILTSSLDMKKCLSSSIIFRLGSGYKWKFNRKPKTVNCNNALQEIKRYKTSEWKSNCRYYFSVVLFLANANSEKPVGGANFSWGLRGWANPPPLPCRYIYCTCFWKVPNYKYNDLLAVESIDKLMFIS